MKGEETTSTKSELLSSNLSTAAKQHFQFNGYRGVPVYSLTGYDIGMLIPMPRSILRCSWYQATEAEGGTKTFGTVGPRRSPSDDQ